MVKYELPGCVIGRRACWVARCEGASLTSTPPSGHSSARAAKSSSAESRPSPPGRGASSARRVGGAARSAGPGPDALEQRAHGEGGVGDDRVAHRGPGGLVVVGGDVQQARALGQERAGHVGVVAEHRRADDEHDVEGLEGLRHRRDRHRQRALELRVVGGEADAPLDGRGEHRGAEPLGERHGVVEAAGGVDVAADHERRGASGVEGRRRGRRVPPGPGPRAGAPGGPRRGRPPRSVGSSTASQSSIGIDTNTGPQRRAGRHVDRAGQHGGDVGRAGRLEGQLDRGPRQHRRVRVREQRLEVHHRPHLLPGRDHQRRAVGGRVDQGAHRVADAGRGVQVDQGRTPAWPGRSRRPCRRPRPPAARGRTGSRRGARRASGARWTRGCRRSWSSRAPGSTSSEASRTVRSLRHASSRRSGPITAMIAVLRRRRQEYPSI